MRNRKRQATPLLPEDRHALLYCRVSTERQAEEGISLEEQLRRVEGRAAELGLPIAGRFIEQGVSGSVPLAERPQGKRLLAAVQPGRSVVICAKLDRMFRSAVDVLQTIQSFRERSIGCYLLDLGGDVSGDGIAKLVLTIMAAVAEWERDRLRERILDAKAYGRKRGDYLGGIVPFGFRLVEGILEPDEGQQAIIADMRGLYAAGESIRGVERILHKRGIAISFGAVRRILLEE